ncbi:hypothetical protein DYI37_18475 [Fulvimarina endophytica]|uniref:Alpha/beta hydrolase n=1 Tax=Fulvimarina endophytica TaxID=2293836 RepID=A0A371WY47_9HYPH|nr:hypothetical protein [Fulvimarina endophytica]RFC61917.1 hypothetical protein DYI37_18475 [Fulvimarina endophytica]
MGKTGGDGPEARIARRLVCLVPGYEPMEPDAHIARFRRAAERSASVFGAQVAFTAGPDASLGEAAMQPDGPFHRLGAALTPKDGAEATHSRIVLFAWDDLIAAYAGRPLAKRIATGFSALFAFLFNGTFLSYCRTSWRYGAFFLFPLLLTLAILALASFVALTLGTIFPGPTTWLVGALIAGVVASILFHLADKRWHLMVALDDWSLARDLCERSNPAIEARIAAFSKAFSAEAARGDVDEIVVAAHSLGASLAVPALAAAFEDGFAPRTPLHVLTVGSSLMKTALHPAAGWQREAVRRILVDHAVAWTDCQALSDPINFYKSDPARSLGIAADPGPVVVKLRLKHMVSADTYRRIKRDFFRLHRQFVLAVERRCPYSFHMLLLGPAPLEAFRTLKSVDRPPLCAPGTDPQAGREDASGRAAKGRIAR